MVAVSAKDKAAVLESNSTQEERRLDVVIWLLSRRNLRTSTSLR